MMENTLNITGPRTVVVTWSREGYRVALHWRPDTWLDVHTLTHVSLFENAPAAHRLRESIESSDVIDLNEWVWTPSNKRPAAQLRVAPTAVLSKVAC